MANELVYVAEVDADGVVKIQNRKGFNQDMKDFAGQRIFMRVSRYKADKSKNQRGYYRAVIVPEILEGLVDVGYRRSQLSLSIVHDMLKEKFLKREVVSEHGEFMNITLSSEDCDWDEYCTFITECIEWAATYLNISISPPVKKQWRLNLKESTE